MESVLRRCGAWGVVVHAVLVGGLGAIGFAQVPPGFVVSAYPAYRAAGCCYGEGAVHVVDPTTGAVQMVQGLGVELTGSEIPAEPGVVGTGAFGVILRARDQAIVCGEEVEAGDALDLHVLTLSGLAVVDDRVVPLGIVAASGGSVRPWAELAPDLVLVSVDDATGAFAATVDLVTGSVAPLPIQVVAADTSPQGDVLFATPSAGGYDIYVIPRGSGSVRHVLRTTRFEDFVMHGNGRIYVTREFAVREIEPTTGTERVVASFPFLVGELALEAASGDLLVAQVPLGLSAPLYRLSLGGTHSQLTSLRVSALAVRANPRPYGSDTPAAHRYRWTPWQPPVGLPRLGSMHALQVTAEPPASASGVVLLSTGPGSTPFAGVELLLDPAGLAFLAAMPPSGRLPLPIPNRGALVGQTVYFQTLHLDSGGLAASDGLAVTIMP